MAPRRQRHLARLFLLVLVTGLAVLCCACAHLTDHACCGHDACAICAILRGELRRATLGSILLIALAAAFCFIVFSISRRIAPIISLYTLRVRLND